MNREINQIGFRQTVKGNLLGFHNVNQFGKTRSQGLNLLWRLCEFLRKAKLRIFVGPVINEGHERKLTADVSDGIWQADKRALRLKNIFVEIANRPYLRQDQRGLAAFNEQRVLEHARRAPGGNEYGPCSK